MAEYRKLETSTAVSNVTPTSGTIASWFENEDGTIKQKAKLSDGTVVEITSKPKVYTSVSASTWSSSATYSDYPYECSLSVTGVTSDSDVDVIFGLTEAASGNYAPVCNSGSGTVTIYSKVNTAITVAKVRVF